MEARPVANNVYTQSWCIKQMWRVFSICQTIQQECGYYLRKDIYYFYLYDCVTPNKYLLESKISGGRTKKIFCDNEITQFLLHTNKTNLHNSTIFKMNIDIVEY